MRQDESAKRVDKNRLLGHDERNYPLVAPRRRQCHYHTCPPFCLPVSPNAGPLWTNALPRACLCYFWVCSSPKAAAPSPRGSVPLVSPWTSVAVTMFSGRLVAAVRPWPHVCSALP